MAEIEITTGGEIKLAGDVVGQITWTRPYVESEAAGVYDDHGYGYDEWGDQYECSGCIERQSLLDLAKEACEKINAIGLRVQTRLERMRWEDDELNGLIREIRAISDEVEFEI